MTLRRRALRWAASIPVTWVVVALAITASVVRLSLKPGRARGSIDSFVSTGFDAVFVHHDWYSTITSVFFVFNPVVLGLVVVALIVGMGWSERRMGHWRTIVVFVAVTVIGILLGLVSEGLGIGLDVYSAEITRLHRTTDPVIALVGVVMAASAFTGPLLKRRIRIVGFAAILMFVLYSGQPSDVFRLFAAIVGLLLGMVLARTPLRVRRPRATRRESRTLLAAVVAVTALGPLVTVVSPSGSGVLNPLGLLFRDPLRDYAAIAARCETSDYSRHCVDALALSRLDGPGAVLLTFLPLVALLAAAWGIQRGRRIGLWLAVTINVALTALAAVYFGFVPFLTASAYTVFQTTAAEDYRPFEVVSALVPLLIAGVLVASSRLFPVDDRASEGMTVRRFGALVALEFLAVAGIYFAIVASVPTQFTPTASLVDLLLDLPERFVPVSFLAFEPADIFPSGPVAVIASQWVGVAFWLAVIVTAVIGMRRPHPHGSDSDEARIRSLLVAGSGGTLSWMTTWLGNHYWFAPSGGAVAYRVVNGVAITTGDPLGPVATHPETALLFATYCTDRGWTPAFYSVTDALRGRLVDAGWSSLQVAEETIVRPAGWSTEGKKMQDIRTSINRATKEGVRAEWHAYSELPPAITRQIKQLSELWVAEKDLPEMGFTLGGLDELIDADVRLMIAVDSEGSVQGVTSWLPTFDHGRVVGWTLDFMRRSPETMNGLMEFLIAQAILRARDEGISLVSLSGAPLARSDETAESDDERSPRILSFLSRTLEPVYGFRSLLRFKMKFRPEFESLHLCYLDPLTLPGIGLALTRAYLPTLSARQALRTLSAR